jgi:hypothetical protein
MGTTLVVLHPLVKNIKVEDGYLIDYELPNGVYDGYTEIGTNNYIYENVEPLVRNLKPETPIYAMDDDTDFKTINDYLKYIDKQ